MKSRLAAHLLTPEDYSIWLGVAARMQAFAEVGVYDVDQVLKIALESDGIDADNMFHFGQRLRTISKETVRWHIGCFDWGNELPPGWGIGYCEPCE